jgi:hypothetical protein
MTDQAGKPRVIPPKPDRSHKYASTATRLRNLRWAAVQVVLSYSPAQLRAVLNSSPPVPAEQLAKFLTKPVTTVRKAVQSARADEGDNLEEEAMSAEELEEALDTPTTDDPRGPRYRDLPEVQDWLKDRAS